MDEKAEENEDGTTETNLLLFSAETRTKELKKSTAERRDVF